MRFKKGDCVKLTKDIYQHSKGTVTKVTFVKPILKEYTLALGIKVVENDIEEC